ncbi:hypothetical protein F2Q69_00035439 [Brassica cretica]|uniref:Uncharacterized protein n=1 Tax=Brassica cretica TaxID=69181 RepID=A0A8S9SSB8_BRACR|nr:hypothetical protein F2Q69_00035439 [Brassica cretica]
MPSHLLPRLRPARRRHRPLHTRARTCSLLCLHQIFLSSIFFRHLAVAASSSPPSFAEVESTCPSLPPPLSSSTRKSFHTRAFLPLLTNDSGASHTRAPRWCHRC